ncbi:MAG: energy-coupling factor ABC transporter ATP-binding protein [Magnetococcales bacterium]|nr:energy-coupling factor ABC transporter ATP-binding protein [Magnetococcales bacterium]
MTANNPLLVLTDINYTLPDHGPELFSGLQLTVGPGERLAVVAGEGEGKSTLMRLMAGLIPPTKGVVALSGNKLDSPPPQPGGIGVLFSDATNHFLTPVVQEEILLGMDNRDKSDGEDKVGQYLELAGFPAHKAGCSLVKLSTSQQSRVAVAAVLASQPCLVLADEPGNYLDMAGEEQLAKTFFDLTQKKNMAQVIFTSRLERANRFAKRILFLNNGVLSNTPSPKGRF